MPTVYVTAPPEAGRELAEQLVEQRHAACVNILNMHSVYRWEGDVVHDEEVVLLAKTTADAYDDLESFVQTAHPYDEPCIERFDEAAVAPSFAEWIRDAVDA
ncbi:MAG: divalent-cation tolerance protein CutA [Halobacterium sp.]